VAEKMDVTMQGGEVTIRCSLRDAVALGLFVWLEKHPSLSLDDDAAVRDKDVAAVAGAKLHLSKAAVRLLRTVADGNRVRAIRNPRNEASVGRNRTVWVNRGACIGRFGRMGIDIHREPEDAMALGECLLCTHKPTTKDDWLRARPAGGRRYHVRVYRSGATGEAVHHQEPRPNLRMTTARRTCPYGSRVAERLCRAAKAAIGLLETR